MTLDELLDALSGEWAEGVTRLDEFEQLFDNVEHVKLLNVVGGSFFADVQRILWDDLLLRITRLTDPKQTGRGKGRSNDNLTVRQLPGVCEVCERDDLREKVEEQVEAAIQAAKFARSHRNKRIGHKDRYPIELPSTSLRQIRGALDAVYTVLQTVYMGLRSMHLAVEVVDRRPGVRSFLARTEHLVDAVLCVDELLALSGRKPVWDEDVAHDCILKLRGTPSEENVRRIVSLRTVAGWLRKDSDGNYVATFPGASPGITGLGRRASWQSCIDHCPKVKHVRRWRRGCCTPVQVAGTFSPCSRNCPCGPT